MSFKAIAIAWMASAHWGGWRKGMVDFGGYVFDGSMLARDGHRYSVNERSIPDLSHLGTRAFLQEDVRKAWGIKEAYVSFGESSWTYWVPDVGCIDEHDTEEEALLAALQAAPEAA